MPQVLTEMKDPVLPTSLKANCAELLSLVANVLRQPQVGGRQADPGPDPSAPTRQALLHKLQLISQQEVGSAAAQAIVQDMHAIADWQLLASHMQTASLSAVALARE